MDTITIRRGLDIPITGGPEQRIGTGPPVGEVALVGDDYPGMKPTMLVKEGERVRLGQPLFSDKKNEAVLFTAPAAGTVRAIHRGAKRRFESVVITLDGDEAVEFGSSFSSPASQSREDLRSLLLRSGLWTSFRTRPFGKIPAADATPHSLFITALDTAPLAADPLVLVQQDPALLTIGLECLQRLLDVPMHLCVRPHAELEPLLIPGVSVHGFAGPHPAGLPSTHIHYLDPVHAQKQVWHLDVQDLLAIGHLCKTGTLATQKVIALAGPGVKKPRLLTTRPGASLEQLTRDELHPQGKWRLLSGSVLDGRIAGGTVDYLGRYHRQVAVLEEGAGRSLFGWLAPGRDRFSTTGLFASRWSPAKRFEMITAAWGGRRAIYPLGVYEKVLDLDIIATSLLKSLAVGDPEKAAALGCLELIEEDLALCSFVCPGKNEFGPMLRSVLTAIEAGE
nr:Na(+)-translocating NADH-quinone reductase subunit A [uncultured Desulfobulbus sp.]